MKNKIIYLIIVIIILGILTVLYIKGAKNNSSVTTDNTNNETITSEQLPLVNVKNASQLIIKNENNEYTVKLSDKKYTVTDYENNTFSEKELKQIFSIASSFSSEQLIEENSSNLSKYGLAQPVATVNIKGDNECTLKIGSLTSDSKYRYVNTSTNNNVYIANKGYAELFTKDVKDFIDKTVVSFSADSVNYVEIRQKDKPDILINSSEDNSALKNYVSSSGLSAFVMESPLKNAIVYPNNMQDTLLCDLSYMVISDIAELKTTDISKYGLDNPDMDITLKTSSDSLRVRTGNKANDKDVYVLINERPEIYTMNSDCFSAFTNVNIMDFIQNFISLHARSTVEKVNITNDTDSHLIEFKTEGDNKIAVDSEGVKRDNRNTYINKVLIDKENFGNFYEMLAGINFDSIEYNAANIPSMDNKAYSIEYTLTDNNVETINLYNYNDNFYFIKKDSNILLVNKQQLNQLENKINELTK